MEDKNAVVHCNLNVYTVSTKTSCVETIHFLSRLLGEPYLFDQLKSFTVMTPRNASKILTSIALEKAKSVAVRIGKGEVLKACGHKYTHQHGDDDDNSTEYRRYTSHSEYTAKGVHQIDELIELMTEKDKNLETYVCNSANEDTLRRATEIGICSTSISSIAIQLVIWFLVILLLLIIVVIFMMLYRKYKNKEIPQRIITRA